MPARVKVKKRPANIIFLLALLLVSVVAAASIGSAKISILTAAKIIFHRLFGIFEKDWGSTEELIILSIRTPRIILALLVGGALSCAGAVFQALLKNPLADPYVLGVSSGSAVGACIAIILGLSATFLGTLAIPILAFLGALATIFLVYLISRDGTKINVYTMLLAGVICGTFFSAVIMFLISISGSHKLKGIMFWLMGDLSGGDPSAITLAFIIISIGIVVIYLFSSELNLMTFGEESAASMGVNVERVKIAFFVMASLITATAVSISGLIGFVGLIIPHIARMLFGPDHKTLLPASLILGSAFLVIADTLARTVIAPYELPVGVVTAFCGAPFFVYLLKKRKGFGYI
jgi:iron complex transport system permease protein